MTKCECGEEISPERVAALSEAGMEILCKTCSDNTLPKRIGFMDYGHKTAGELVMLAGDDDESIRRARRCYRRAR